LEQTKKVKPRKKKTNILQAKRPKLPVELKISTNESMLQSSENELISREVVQGYAKCTSDICVRMGWSKHSEFLTTLKKGTFVWIFEINYNRANIYFGEQNGWCTIFLENEQRFLLSQGTNQKQAKELYNAQFMDIVDYDVDMYEEEYLFSGMDFGNVFDAFHNLRYKKIIEKEKSKFWKKHFNSIADPKMEEDLYMSKKDDSKEQQRVRRNRIKFKRVLNQEYEEWEKIKVVRESEAREKRRVKLERYVEELRERKKAELESEQEQLEKKNANLQYYLEELEKLELEREKNKVKVPRRRYKWVSRGYIGCVYYLPSGRGTIAFQAGPFFNSMPWLSRRRRRRRRNKKPKKYKFIMVSY